MAQVQEENENLVEKFVGKAAIGAGIGAAELADNLKHNYSAKHAGSYDELLSFMDKNSTKSDWLLSQMAFDEKSLDPEMGNLDLLEDLFDDEVSIKMNKVTSRHAGAAAATGANKDLRFIQVYDEANDTMTIVFSGLGPGAETQIVGKNPAATIFGKTDFSYGKGKVSKPIFDIYDNMRASILEALDDVNPGKVKFVGHSLGGALAEMAAADAGLGVSNKTVTAFSPPPFADIDFVNAYPDINVHRIGNKYDPVMFKLGVGSKHPTKKIWDITNITSEELNDKFWKSLGTGESKDVLIDMTHRGGGLEKSFDDVLYNPENLQSPNRAAGDLVFDNRLLRFLDTIETKVGATTSDGIAALKELYKASGGDVDAFKSLFKDKVVTKVMDVLKSKTSYFDISDSLDDLSKIADFDVLDATSMDPFDDITKLEGLDDVTRIDDIGFTERGVASTLDDLDSPLLKGVRRAEKAVTNLKVPILRGIQKSVGKNPAIKGASKLAANLAKKSKGIRGAFKGLKPGISATLKNLGKGAKVVGKGVARAVDFGVMDAAFVVVDSVEDFDRIDDESVYTMWNGVPIHKLYSPDEYAYINGLKSLYHVMGGFESTGVPIDGFLNTWFGRVDEDENGDMTIDGEIADMNVFYRGSSYSVATARSSEGVQLDDKTEAVAKNAGKGLLSFLVGAAIMTTAVAFAPVTGGVSLVAGAAASVGAGIAIEAADEAIEAVSIGERANNFNQAFQKKVINDYLDGIIFSVVDIYGTINERHIDYERRLLNRALLYNDNGALGTLANQGYPKKIVSYIGKVLRYNIQRINTDIDYEENIDTVINDTLEILADAGQGIADVNKTRIELNKKYDDLYLETAGDINLNLNLLYETITDEDSGLKQEEIEEILKQADALVNGDNERKTREYRNLQLENVETALDELLEGTLETVEARKDFQKEVNAVNEEIEKIRGELDEERKRLKEAASDLGEDAEKLKEQREKIIAAGKSVQEAAELVQKGREDLQRRLEQERDRKIQEREKEVEEIIATETRRVEDLQKRHDRQQNKESKAAVENANLTQGDFQEGDINYDRGLPELESERFEPDGKSLPFTFDSGAPKMLFEDGKELTYTGPSNALAGGISQGNWTGVIPNANKPPVNLLDNYYMAYHIENQDDETLAKGRLVKRISRAINKKEISQDKDIVEYRIALLTLKHMETYKNIFGIEISNSFMQNGLGAVIRDQVYETITNPLRNGALPATFSLGDDINLDFSIDADPRKNLKRASDVAFAGGDKMMGLKFQRIQTELVDMERVASEYLEAAQGYSKDKSISLGMDRLSMEGIIETEQKEEAFAKLIISILNKPLIDII